MTVTLIDHMGSDESVARAALIPLRARDGCVRAYAMVDAADAAWANQYRWRMVTKGYASRTVRVGKKTESFLLHRELMGLTKGDPREVDHRDRSRLNCCRSNLRVVERGQNQQNKSSANGSTSRFRGVSKQHNRPTWRAGIKVDGKSIHLGTFVSETEAAEVARIARLQHHPLSNEGIA